MHLFGVALSWYWNKLTARGAAMSTIGFICEVTLIFIVAFGVLVLPLPKFIGVLVWLAWPTYFAPVHRGFENIRIKRAEKRYDDHLRAMKTRDLIDRGIK